MIILFSCFNYQYVKYYLLTDNKVVLKISLPALVVVVEDLVEEATGEVTLVVEEATGEVTSVEEEDTGEVTLVEEVSGEATMEVVAVEDSGEVIIIFLKVSFG